MIKFIPSDDYTYISDDERWGVLIRECDNTHLLYKQNLDGIYVYEGLKFETMREVEKYVNFITAAHEK